MSYFITAVFTLAVFLSSVHQSAVAQEQYKKFARDSLALLADGDPSAALAELNGYLQDHPDDIETLYALALTYAHVPDMDQAITHVHKALEAGLPFQRFQAGPRELMTPLLEHKAFQALSQEKGAEFLHGPTLGCMKETSVKIWVRTFNEIPVRATVKSVADPALIFQSDEPTTSKDKDYTAIMSVSGLQPGAAYDYTLEIDGKKQPQTWTFKTHPKAKQAATFQVGFGGGAGYTPQYERMWRTISQHPLQAFLFLGDNVYIDHPTRPAVQRYCYYRRQSRPEFREFAAAIPLYAIWDDHDFTDNDNWGGPEIDDPAWKRDVWKTFMNNWNNPSYGGGADQPGCWFDFSIADVDFFMLDGRYYREDPETDNPSMLGPVQLKWLLEKLNASKATFKIIASPVPWAENAKPGSLDPWDGYKEERQAIYSFIEEQKIEGVALISADRHRSDVWRIKNFSGYELYEFESSRLSNIHTHKAMPGSIFSYNEKCSFGILEFNTELDDPTLAYKIQSIDNEEIHTFEIKRSQLTYQ